MQRNNSQSFATLTFRQMSASRYAGFPFLPLSICIRSRKFNKSLPSAYLLMGYLLIVLSFFIFFLLSCFFPFSLPSFSHFFSRFTFLFPFTFLFFVFFLFFFFLCRWSPND